MTTVEGHDVRVEASRFASFEHVVLHDCAGRVGRLSHVDLVLWDEFGNLVSIAYSPTISCLLSGSWTVGQIDVRFMMRIVLSVGSL